jgi:P-type Ca2+ transporter type 2C
MIIGQSIFQLVVTLVIYFAGERIFSYHEPKQREELQTAIFNTFVFMQIFNQYNNRRLDNKFNILEGVHRNYFFIGIQFIIFGGQILIVFFGGKAFSVVRLTGEQWAFSVILGLCSLPAAVLIRLIPDDLILRLVPAWFKRKRTPKLVVSDEAQHYEWNPALEDIREELSVLKILRGGRLKALRYRLQHPRDTLLLRSRSGSRSRASSSPQTPPGGLNNSEFANGQAPATPESRKSTSRRSRSNSAFGPAAAMAGIVAGSIAGWSPVGRRDEEDASVHPRTQDRSELGRPGGLGVHPDTDAHDHTLSPDSATGREPPSQDPEKSFPEKF